MNRTAEVIVLNVPEYAMHKRFWVVTPDNGDLWFWGAWDEYEQCGKYDREQIVVENTHVKGE